MDLSQLDAALSTSALIMILLITHFHDPPQKGRPHFMECQTTFLIWWLLMNHGMVDAVVSIRTKMA